MSRTEIGIVVRANRLVRAVLVSVLSWVDALAIANEYASAGLGTSDIAAVAITFVVSSDNIRGWR